MAIENTQNLKTILLFKDLIESLENQEEALAIQLHSEIIPRLVTSKMNVVLSCKKLLNDKFNAEAMEEDLKELNELFESLRTLMNGLYPALLNRYGVFKTFESCVRSFSKNNSIIIDLKYDEMQEKFPFSERTELNLFKLLEATLNFFYNQVPNKNISVFISIASDNIIVDFIRKKKSNVRYKDGTRDSDLNSIKARLLMLNAQVSENTDWHNFIQIFIPFENKNIYGGND